MLDNYQRQPRPDSDAATWFREFRTPLEQGVGEPEGPAVLGVLALLQADRECVADLGAVNRWQARTGVPVEEYLRQWQASCAEIAAPGLLPGRVRSLFGLA